MEPGFVGTRHKLAECRTQVQVGRAFADQCLEAVLKDRDTSITFDRNRITKLLDHLLYAQKRLPSRRVSPCAGLIVCVARQDAAPFYNLTDAPKRASQPHAQSLTRPASATRQPVALPVSVAPFRRLG